MSSFRSRGWVWVVAMLYLWFSLGCTRLKVSTGPYAGEPVPVSNGETSSQPETVRFSEGAGVVFTAFYTAGDARRQEVFQGEVLAQLWLTRDGQRELVHRSQASSWSRLDLIPGDYELEILKIYQGDKEYPPNDDNLLSFHLDADSTAQVNLVVKQVPWGVIAVSALAVVVVVGVIAYVVVVQEAPDLKIRPPSATRISSGHARFAPPPAIRLPHGSLGHLPHAHMRLWMPYYVLEPDLQPFVSWGYYAEGQPPPPEQVRILQVTVPNPVDPSGRVVVQFAEPMEPFFFEPGTIQLLGPSGQPVAGGVFYRSDTRTATFHPLRPLEPGRYVIRVVGELLQSQEGQRPAPNVAYEFQMGQAG